MANYSATGLYPSLNGVQNSLINLAQSNNAYSASQAADLRRWQEGQNKIAMDFNAAEAGKSRDWTEYMSNTAHQREVADLKAAGLNPVLSATGGNGAAVTSGATASGVTSSGAMGETDKSASQNIASLIATLWEQQNALQMQKNSAELTEAENEKARSMNYTLGLLSSNTSKYVSDQSAWSAKYRADTDADIAQRNLDWKTEHPDNMYQVAEAILGYIFGDTSNPVSAISGGLDAFGKWLDGLFSGEIGFKSDKSSSSHYGKF